MNPRIVLVIGKQGISLTRLVSQSDVEERQAFSLLQKVRPCLKEINRKLKGRSSMEIGKAGGQTT